MVFTVLGRFETSQGLLCNLSGVPGTYENTWLSWSWDVVGPPKGSHWLLFGSRLVPGQVFTVFYPYLDGFRGVRALLTLWFSQSWGVARAPRGSLETLLSIPGSFLPGTLSVFSYIYAVSVGSGPSRHAVKHMAFMGWDAVRPPKGYKPMKTRGSHGLGTL